MVQDCGALLPVHSNNPTVTAGRHPGVPSSAPTESCKGHSSFEVEPRIGDGEQA